MLLDSKGRKANVPDRIPAKQREAILAPLREVLTVRPLPRDGSFSIRARVRLVGVR